MPSISHFAAFASWSSAVMGSAKIFVFVFCFWAGCCVDYVARIGKEREVDPQSGPNNTVNLASALACIVGFVLVLVGPDTTGVTT